MNITNLLEDMHKLCQIAVSDGIRRKGKERFVREYKDVKGLTKEQIEKQWDEVFFSYKYKNDSAAQTLIKDLEDCITRKNFLQFKVNPWKGGGYPTCRIKDRSTGDYIFILSMYAVRPETKRKLYEVCKEYQNQEAIKLYNNTGRGGRVGNAVFKH